MAIIFHHFYSFFNHLKSDSFFADMTVTGMYKVTRCSRLTSNLYINQSVPPLGRFSIEAKTTNLFSEKSLCEDNYLMYFNIISVEDGLPWRAYIPLQSGPNAYTGTRKQGRV